MPPLAASRTMSFFCLALIVSIGLDAPVARSADPLWSDVDAGSIPGAGLRADQHRPGRTLVLDVGRLDRELSRAPREGTAAAGEDPLLLTLPLPDGGASRFAIVESPLLAPELAARHTGIRTYLGRGLDDPTATARLDRTPHGFHALLFLAAGTAYIDPYQGGDVEHYLAYWRRDAHGPGLSCRVIDEIGAAAEIRSLVASGLVAGHGTQLRTYRAAVAATGEYTAFHGGTVPLGLAAVTTAMNRVTGVYEREVALRMQLVAGNDLLIYTNPNTDPYSNYDGAAMLGENQTVLDAVIGNGNYDIGHVFSTGGGGIAYLGVVCVGGYKARGVTGSPSPAGDAFYIDYVAHEVGHQFGGHHTFNGNAGACGMGGQWYAPTAHEPGSGSTIMAYAGICAPQDLQLHSDAYFHFASLQEIVAYTTIGSGNGCASVAPTGVVVPGVQAGTGGFTLPKGTPFTLTATATVAGTPTYCWEESDLGPQGPPNSPSGTAPIFRSFSPVADARRTFPRLSDILTNSQTIGELLPSYARSLSFRVTVRDVQAGGIGVESAALALSVTGAAGPFVVTYPNTTGLQLTGGGPLTVTWSVAGTSAPPVNCQSVNVRFSTDNGTSFPTTLAAGTPNDGSETVLLPNVSALVARIKVEAADHVFFDIGNSFRVTPGTGVEDTAPAAVGRGLVLAANRPNPFHPRTQITFTLPVAGPVALSVYDLSGRLVRTLVAGSRPAGPQAASWDGRDERGLPVASGIYLYELTAGAERATRRMLLLK